MCGMKKWELLFFGISGYEGRVTDPDSAYRGEYLHELLPKLGSDGWELVAVAPRTESTQTMYFKRPKSASSSKGPGAVSE